MAALGLEQSIRELQDIISSEKSSAITRKKTKKLKLGLTTPLRRSDRLQGKSYDFDCSPPQGLHKIPQFLTKQNLCVLYFSGLIILAFLFCQIYLLKGMNFQ